MMKDIYKGKVVFITPCFMTGANQNKPEVRPSSIRGQLRWFFRVLGGTPEEESAVFGGTAPASSAVVVRVSDVKQENGVEITLEPYTPKQYLYYFAEASGKKEGIRRTGAGNYFDIGSSFVLHISQRRELTPGLTEKLELAREAFLVFGALGLRATRGCGAFSAEGHSYSDDLASRLKEKKFFIGTAGSEADSGMKAQLALGGWLKEFRGDNHLSGRDPTALGFSNGRERESSALKLRPVKTKDGFLPLFYYSDAACTQKSIEDLLQGLFK